MLERWRRQAERFKAESYALYLAARHPGTPWYAKVWLAVVVAYAFSPIDLIPDFIPVVGYLDDLVLLALGLALAIRLVPGPVLDECRARARSATPGDRPVSRAAAVVIVAIWLALTALGLYWGYESLAGTG